MNRFLLVLFAVMGLATVSNAQINVDNIDPFIGTGGHGHTHPAATVPFGMVQVGPDTRLEGWDGCSGYHYTDSAIYGFSHTHLSGTGVSDYGDILFRPIMDTVQAKPNVATGFKKLNEHAEAGYYRVELDNGILCEFTASERIGMHRYTFPTNQPALIFIDLNHRDETTEARAILRGDTMITGRRYSSAWAQNQKIHFAAVANLPFEFRAGDIENTWLLDFGLPEGSIEIEVALSGSDEQGAINNLKAETRPFEDHHTLAIAKWNKELYKTEVAGGTLSERIIFATSLYHAYSVPNIWSDVDGRYRGMDDEIHTDTEAIHYTVFSLWDTYRTAHPLYAITQPERTQDFITTMLDQFDQYGRLPIWELAANETNCMIGYHSVSVLADAISKGYEVDGSRVLEAMDKTAKASLYGLDEYRENGYLSIQDESESVSKTLEYSYDDACISWTAAHFGNEEMAEEYRKRSSGYRSVTDLSTGLVRPRDNGGFLAHTNPREVNSHFTEANAWQYSFAPVHDIEGWLKELGNGNVEKGRLRLEQNLDSLFVAPMATTGRDQADITGLIGQYAHGNEPSHHISFLYNATHSPWKTQKMVDEILTSFYTIDPDGLIGNEDCGQMSAWYVMSSMGLYPLVPGIPEYTMSTPIWDSIRVELPNKKILQIKTNGKGAYVSKVQFNGVDQNENWVSHKTLLKGGVWDYTKSAEPTSWGSKTAFVTSMNSDVVAAPIIDSPRRFKDVAIVNFEPAKHHSKLNVWTPSQDTLAIGNNAIISSESAVYYSAFVNKKTGENGHKSRTEITKKPGSWNAEIVAGTPKPQYTAGGPSSLVDGIKGDLDWRKGDWIGVQGERMEILLTNPDIIEVTSIKVHLLKDIGSWIALPGAVSVWVELDGEWTKLEVRDLSSKALIDDADALYNVEWVGLKGISTDKVKIELANAGVLEDWHPGAGGDSFFFIDEIEIE